MIMVLVVELRKLAKIVMFRCQEEDEMRGTVQNTVPIIFLALDASSIFFLLSLGLNFKNKYFTVPKINIVYKLILYTQS